MSETLSSTRYLSTVSELDSYAWALPEATSDKIEEGGVYIIEIDLHHPGVDRLIIPNPDLRGVDNLQNLTW